MNRPLAMARTRLRHVLPLVLLLGTACGQRSGRDAGAATTAAPGTRHGLTTEQARQVLAQVGPHEITLGEFADRLAEQSPYLRARYNSPERRRELLDNMVRFELLALEAERRGYRNDPDVARAERQALVQELLKREVEDKIRLEDVTDAEVRAYYEAHPDEYHQPAQVRASHIRFADRASAQRALAQLEAHPDDIELFRRLARESSTDEATRAIDGDLHFFSRPVAGAPHVDGAPPEAVANAAFEIPTVGGLCPRVVQSPDGFHLVKLTARRNALERSLADATPIIRNLLWRKKREEATQALIARLRSAAHVQEDPSVLAGIHVEAPPASPVAAPAGSAPR